MDPTFPFRHHRARFSSVYQKDHSVHCRTSRSGCKAVRPGTNCSKSLQIEDKPKIIQQLMPRKCPLPPTEHRELRETVQRTRTFTFGHRIHAGVRSREFPLPITRCSTCRRCLPEAACYSGRPRPSPPTARPSTYEHDRRQDEAVRRISPRTRRASRFRES